MKIYAKFRLTELCYLCWSLTVSVHGLCGMWGMIAVGIFAKEDTISEGFTFNAYNGVLYGDSYLLLVQVPRDKLHVTRDT